MQTFLRKAKAVATILAETSGDARTRIGLLLFRDHMDVVMARDELANDAYLAAVLDAWAS